MRRAPALYWLSLAYLVVSSAAPGFFVYLSFPDAGDAIDNLTAFFASAACFLAALALIFRRKIAVPLLIAGLVLHAAGFFWILATQAPSIAHPAFLAGRAIGLGILLAIVAYSRALARRRFLTRLF